MVLTGTGTGVGKTVVTAAVAALALDRTRSVAVLKPAQTGVGPGEPGDVARSRRLAGERRHDLGAGPLPRPARPGRRRAPLRAAARHARRRPPPRRSSSPAGTTWCSSRAPAGCWCASTTTAARSPTSPGPSARPVLIVANAGLGTLNATALTAEALRRRGIACAGVVVGSWPAEPDLAARSNLDDLPTGRRRPAGRRHARRTRPGWRAPTFLAVARRSLAPVAGRRVRRERVRRRVRGVTPQVSPVGPRSPRDIHRARHARPCGRLARNGAQDPPRRHP